MAAADFHQRGPPRLLQSHSSPQLMFHRSFKEGIDFFIDIPIGAAFVDQ
jgi:hypothetical protein